jgi:hypothetical protein
MAEQWIKRVEIRRDGTYINGVKVGDAEARDIKERFETDQRIHRPLIRRLWRRTRE